MFASFGPEDDEGADDEGRRHRHRIEQSRLDRLAEEQAQYRQWDEGRRDVAYQASRFLILPQGAEYLRDAHAVLPANGEDRTRLDHDFEQLALLVVEVQQIAGENQVAGGGDWEELGEAFDQAENQRLQQRVEIHVGRINRRRIRALSLACGGIRLQLLQPGQGRLAVRAAHLCRRLEAAAAGRTS